MLPIEKKSPNAVIGTFITLFDYALERFSIIGCISRHLETSFDLTKLIDSIIEHKFYNVFFNQMGNVFKLCYLVDWNKQELGLLVTDFVLNLVYRFPTGGGGVIAPQLVDCSVSGGW
ncbi:hypothetical protein TNCV_1866561 [Trichonephila clavipes]|nr:hypothetical protein TNCV_1866561 [Trichonephila clavipes]